ncbi:MAG: hypothetical protein ACYSUN_16815, partial [Planctomycetota bacterium]
MTRFGNGTRDARRLLWLAPVVSVLCFGCPRPGPDASVKAIGFGALEPGETLLELPCTTDAEPLAAETFWITTDDDNVLMSAWTESDPEDLHFQFAIHDDSSSPRESLEDLSSLDLSHRIGVPTEGGVWLRALV